MDSEAVAKFSSPPKFAKTAREWILASALYDGIEDEDIRQIEMLVSERGANPNVLLPEYGISPFHLVVANDSTKFAVQATDLCLQHGADPNVRSEDGLTPVHLAAMWGCHEVLHLLLATGGNPWLVDDLGLNAFDYAEREKQHQCYQLLKAICNSQPKPSGCQKSPYHLNLKRVILYKNDLQIVYEASPTSAQKSTSTQTSPNAKTQTAVQEISHNLNQKDCSSGPKHEENKVFLYNKDADHTMENNDSPVTSKLKTIIETHRRNSMLYEYSPSNVRKSSLNSGVDSWKGTNQSDLVMTCYAELVNKLDESNKIRQSLKGSDNSSDLLKNITQRKVPCATPKPFKSPTVGAPLNSSYFSSVSENSTFDKSSQYEVPQNEIGFVLDSTKANSTVIDDRNSCLNDSPPSIGFILDNLSDLCNDQNSLFSDIASDVEAFTTPVHNNVENIMSEDEKPSDVKVSSENSLRDSLYPYVSCENTRERESKEDFVSCRNSESFDRIKNKQEPPSIVDALNDYFEKNPKPPAHPEVITSTPEKSADGGGSTENTFQSAKGGSYNHNEQRVQPVARNLAWVEATVASSSDEEPCISISEEYEYTDLDEGVVLIEKRYLTKDISMSAADPASNSAARESSSSECESVSTLSGSEGAYDTDDLRRALVQHGFVPGPITGNTKRVYLRKLKRCRRKPQPPRDTSLPAFSSELLKTLAQPCEHLLAEWAHLEDSMAASFTCQRRPWREGQAKTSFTYLLLDPRVSHNLPVRAAADPTLTHTLWGEFLRSVFYVGKGKRSRPYSHLYQAVAAWQQQEYKGSCTKIQRILDVWKSGEGVICLHIFLNVIPVEAFTREAAMICAITLPQLTNEQVGKFYGSAASWSDRLKRRLGCVLLHRAFKVFLAEGERQLRPADID